MSRSIIVLPDDSAKPILNGIANAAKSIRIKMFIFSDPSLLQAVITAQNIRCIIERRELTLTKAAMQPSAASPDIQ